MQSVQAEHPRRRAADAGFSLVETVLSLVVLSVVVIAAVPFFVGSLRSTAGLGAKQAALTVASRQLEYVRSIAPDRLVTGRHATDVAALIASPGLVVLTGDVTATGNSDPAAILGSAAATVPLTATQTVNSVTFTTRTYINLCYLSKTTGICTASPLNGPVAYRVSVDVSWPAAPGVTCPTGRSGQCEFVNSTLIDGTDDPTFSTAAAPAITSLGRVEGSTTTTITQLHPGQLITMQVSGTDFVYGATVFSGSGDVTGAVSSNTGTAMRLSYQASSTLGTRSVVMTNPDGGSATAPLTVATSVPTITAVSGTGIRSTAVTFTFTGTDFFATPTTASPTTQPTVSITATSTFFGIPSAVSPTISGVTVLSATSVRASVTFPWKLFGYTAAGTIRITNPDGGTITVPTSITVL